MSYFLADPYRPSEIETDGNIKVTDVRESRIISHGKNYRKDHTPQGLTLIKCVKNKTAPLKMFPSAFVISLTINIFDVLLQNQFHNTTKLQCKTMQPIQFLSWFFFMNQTRPAGNLLEENK